MCAGVTKGGGRREGFAGIKKLSGSPSSKYGFSRVNKIRIKSLRREEVPSTIPAPQAPKIKYYSVPMSLE